MKLSVTSLLHWQVASIRSNQMLDYEFKIKIYELVNRIVITVIQQCTHLSGLLRDN